MSIGYWFAQTKSASTDEHLYSVSNIAARPHNRQRKYRVGLQYLIQLNYVTTHNVYTLNISVSHLRCYNDLMNVYYDILVDICTKAYTISAHRLF